MAGGGGGEVAYNKAAETILAKDAEQTTIITGLRKLLAEVDSAWSPWHGGSPLMARVREAAKPGETKPTGRCAACGQQTDGVIHFCSGKHKPILTLELWTPGEGEYYIRDGLMHRRIGGKTEVFNGEWDRCICDDRRAPTPLSPGEVVVEGEGGRPEVRKCMAPGAITSETPTILVDGGSWLKSYHHGQPDAFRVENQTWHKQLVAKGVERVIGHEGSGL